MFHVYRYIYRISVTLGGLVLVTPATFSSSEASTCAESRETWQLLTSNKFMALITFLEVSPLVAVIIPYFNTLGPHISCFLSWSAINNRMHLLIQDPYSICK
jgi:hypothetical protein